MKKGFFGKLSFEPHELVPGHIYLDEVNTRWVYLGQFNYFSFNGTNHGKRFHFISETHLNNLMNQPSANHKIESGNILFYPDSYNRKDFVSDDGLFDELVFEKFIKLYLACSIVSPIDKSKMEKVKFSVDDFNRYTTYLQNNPNLLFSTFPSENGKLVFTLQSGFYDTDMLALNHNDYPKYKPIEDTEIILEIFQPYYYKFYLQNGEFAGYSVAYDCVIQFDVFHLN